MEAAMAREDRERNFEKALARNLRSEHPANAATHACPDAELLAAYHERSLSLEEAISWKEHIAGCSQCQQLLAHLEATDEISLDANREEYKGHEVPVASQSDPTVLTPVSVLPSAPAPASTFVGSKTPERRRMLRRPANWRWLAPAGAIAAGLILWVAFHENSSDRFEMAKNQPVVAVPSPPPVSRSRQSESAEPNAAEPKPEPKQQETSRSPSVALSQPSRAPAEQKPVGDENFRAALKQEAAAAPIDKTKADRSRNQIAENSLPLSGRNATDLQELSPGQFDARKDAGELSKLGGVVGGAVSPAAPPPTARATGAAANSPARAASTAAAPSGSAKKNPPPAPPVATESLKATNQNETVVVQSESQGVALDGVSPPGTNADMLRMARNQLPVTIITPNQKVLWRIEAAGIAQRSTDAGSIWTLQKTGVVADLTAGSAPSEKICWIVGRAGTILRTTDSGAHWLQLRSPVTEDLSAVFAIDAQQATVSTATSHKTYKTSDAGQTWTPLSNP
jgi:hypothetical protein